MKESCQRLRRRAYVDVTFGKVTSAFTCCLRHAISSHVPSSADNAVITQFPPLGPNCLDFATALSPHGLLPGRICLLEPMKERSIKFVVIVRRTWRENL
ncbi:hypothetical protein M8J76_001565 [Diaphorina citri]|nr:hypothetical protein M8J75_002823 [Diaphorina citri]KAI5700943.1 hypothetical protein M8J75_004508 [Diaphorina citri]KAI5729342.1 hypothetical protein M8J76_001565 [Diaphorina citri]